MKKSLLTKLMLLLCAVVAGVSSAWAAEDDTHDFSQSLSQLLNNNATIANISISDPGYPIKEIIVTYSWNNAASYSGKVSAQATVGGTSSTSAVTTTKDATLDLTFASTVSGDITISFTNNTGSGTGHGTFKVSNVRLVEGASAYTITPSANDDDMGEVSLTGTTITATPNDGYRVKSGDAGYTVTSGTASVTNNGNNTFTVTPSTDCAITINFEAIPTHDLAYTVTPVGAGTVTLGATSVREGSTTTIEASANAGYKFVGWSVSGTGATIDDENEASTTVTMGTANATVTAEFDAVTTYPIHWSVNGVVIKTDNVEENTAISFNPPASGVPAGYVFKGWVTAANRIDTPTDTDPKANYVNSANSTAEITYYAVMAVLKTEGPDTYEQLSTDAFEAGATYVLGAEQSSTDDTMHYLYSYEKVDEENSWGVTTTDPATNAPITFTLSGTASALVAQDNSGNYLADLKVKTFGMSSTSKSLFLDDDGTILESEYGDYLRHNYNGGSGGFRWYASTTGTQAYFYKVISGDIYGNFCTTVPSATITLASACTDGNGNYYGTYSNSSAFVVPSDLTVSTINVDGTGKLTVSSYSTGDVVKANTGVMVSSTSAGDHTVTLSAATGTELSGNMLKASSVSMTGSDKFYRLTMHNGTQIGFYWGAADGAPFTLGDNKAYLQVSPALARTGFNLFGDEATAISSTKSGAKMEGAEIYNLQGQRIAKPAKGLYIVNGKKYFNK